MEVSLAGPWRSRVPGPRSSRSYRLQGDLHSLPAKTKLRRGRGSAPGPKSGSAGGSANSYLYLRPAAARLHPTAGRRPRRQVSWGRGRGQGSQGTRRGEGWALELAVPQRALLAFGFPAP